MQDHLQEAHRIRDEVFYVPSSQGAKMAREYDTVVHLLAEKIAEIEEDETGAKKLVKRRWWKWF